MDITIHSPPTIHLIKKTSSLHLLYQQNDQNAHHGTSDKTRMEQDNHNGPKQWSPRTYNPWFEKKKKLTTKIDRTKQTQATQQQSKKWVTFTYYSPLVHNITNLFKRTNINIAFSPSQHVVSS